VVRRGPYYCPNLTGSILYQAGERCLLEMEPIKGSRVTSRDDAECRSDRFEHLGSILRGGSYGRVAQGQGRDGKNGRLATGLEEYASRTEGHSAENPQRGHASKRA